MSIINKMSEERVAELEEALASRDAELARVKAELSELRSALQALGSALRTPAPVHSALTQRLRVDEPRVHSRRACTFQWGESERARRDTRKRRREDEG